jgi:hypothetical protein
MRHKKHRVNVELTQSQAEALKSPGIKSLVRRSHEHQVQIVEPSKFFEKMNRPMQSKLATFIEDVKETSEEMLDQTGRSKIVEVDAASGKWRWREVKTTAQLKDAVEQSEKNYSQFMRTQEASMIMRLGEDWSGSSFDGSTQGMGSFPARPEFMPLISSPFYKQLYLYDYWEMHSKCFWFRNYSAIGKMIVDMTRNFVLSKGFTVTFDNKKAEEIWKRYEDYSGIQESVRNWCDELTTFGEIMVKKSFTPSGILHRSIDPSTVWEIVTDPENISDVKYYHQQYNTQYQIFGDKSTPLSKYIINQIPPSLIFHEKVNVTSFEKRGRSDLLSVLLYFKYYEDYMQSRLIRAKNEAAFIWDVTIKGSDEDVSAYIAGTESMADVPPGSENVHNEAIERKPLSPSFSLQSQDMIAQDILSYVAMGTMIPVNYMGTFGTGGNTKAGAVVATEPVAKKMLERQLKLENVLRKIIKDVLRSNNMNPDGIHFEVTFPDILEGDRSTKIQDTIVAHQQKVISHKTMSGIIAKELRYNSYDYGKEQEAIKAEDKANVSSLGFPQLTPDDADAESRSEAIDRNEVRQDNAKL